MTRIAICLGLFLAVNLFGCTQQEALTSEQREVVQRYVGKTATTPGHALDIRFGENVTLIGYDLSEETLVPGQPAKITWHFRVDKAPGEKWRLFTHLADASNRSRVNLDADGPLRTIFPPSRWETGSYVRDEQILNLPKNWNSDKLVVYLGLWRDDERMAIKGPSDKQRRARVLELPVQGAKEEPLAELHAIEVKAAEAKAGQAKTPAIKLDGKLDEAAWKEAKATALFINTMTGEPAEPKVTAKALWDAANLYVAFDVADDYLKSTFEKNDDHLWEQDCVEIMLDPDGDEKNYFELQVSPAGKSFDTRYDSRRVPKPFGHMDFNAGLTNGVDVRGKLNDDDADQGYTVEIAIPWTAFALGEPKHAAPKAGETWRMNLYVMDAREKGMRAVGWSAPMVGDFHVPSRFGKLVFDGAPAAAEALLAPGAVGPQLKVMKLEPAKGETPKAAAKPEPKSP